ncbi:hypothetical protein R5R35_000916 [Gryllus longicercus]|uniref:Golgi SNAP receptor complex member 2 n=1 Tax=Gryllus longicercus TaxID=2509291 RepID=A0AAN9V9C8_9ORTH
MESLYHQTNKLVQETQHRFSQLEKVNSANTESVEKELQARIDQITSNCEKLDIMLFKEPVQRRQNAKLRIDQLKYDNQHLQAGLRMFQHRQYQRLREEQDREELLNRRFTQNSEADTSIFIDHTLQHNMSLQNANRGVDVILQSGSSILENLRDQRTTIKGAHRRLYDIANTLGLSNHTMKLIERRAYQDKFILLGGMIFTLFVIGIVIVYFT